MQITWSDFGSGAAALIGGFASQGVWVSASVQGPDIVEESKLGSPEADGFGFAGNLLLLEGVMPKLLVIKPVAA